MPKYRMRDLYAAAIALLEWEQATKPQIEQQGDRISRKQPVISPLPSNLGFRLALNRNSLRVQAEAYEEEVRKIDEEFREATSGDASQMSEEERKDYARRLQAASKEREQKLRTLESEEIEWQSPAPIEIAKLGDRQIPEGWLAALIAVGVITGEPEKPPA